MEPKYVWRYGRPTAPDDRREAIEAKPAIKRYIRRTFGRFAEQAGKPRFMEKTPSNCFRIPFIHAVLPNALFLHIIRDGRDAARSALKKWTTTPDLVHLRRRFMSFEVPLRDLPFYAVDTLRDVLGRQFFPAKAFIWGPQFPGIREVRAKQGVEVTCAIQWRESVRAAQEGLADVPPDQQLTVRFEDLVREPIEIVDRILRFLSLSPSDALLKYASETLEAEAAARWKIDAPGASLDRHLQPLLSELGYI